MPLKTFVSYLLVFLAIVLLMGYLFRCFIDSLPKPPRPDMIQTVSRDEFSSSVLEFHGAWDRFVRVYLGCPADAVTADACKPSLGILNRALYEKARGKARQVFDFESARAGLTK